MTYTTPAKTIRLLSPTPPNLPIAPTEYNQQYLDATMNVLRLYFNQLNNFTQSFSGSVGGSYLKFPYGAFHQDGNTTLTASMTNSSTTPISVVTTTPFPSAGYLLIGSEIIQYTGVTSTTFTGITRNVLGTSTSAHSSGAQVSEVQGTGSGTTIGYVKINNTDFSNGVTVNTADLSQIVFTYPGVYNITISAQLLSYTNSADNVTMWFAQNGVDIPNSASIQTVPAIHGGVPGAIILDFNIYISASANDYLQIKWTTDSGNSVVATYPPGLTPVHPSSPAVILTVQFVSAN